MVSGNRNQSYPRSKIDKLRLFILSIFTWGHTFFDLNAMLLDNYVTAKDSTEIVEMQSKLLKRKKSE